MLKLKTSKKHPRNIQKSQRNTKETVFYCKFKYKTSYKK